MKYLNICIDIDGTITDPYFWLERVANHFWLTVNYDEFIQYEFHKVLKISEMEYDKFYEEHKLEYHSEDILRNSVVEVINELYNYNNIYFVSARDKSLEMLTLSYLKNNNISFDGLSVLGSHYKVNEAKKLKCDIFIEDNLNNALNLSEAGFKVLLINTTYNQGELNENIKRTYNWIQILSEVKTLIYSNNAV
ncbi:MAG: hypothetical protein H7Y18_14890 [Clostridiaceae bacterium]|nr:hypothetical protein [Clostridiaceae bacterium]